MANDPHTISVLSGDLARSSELSATQIEGAMDALTEQAKALSTFGVQNFTRQSGDGWQVVVEDPKYALHVALILRATLRSLGADHDSYIAIANGDILAPTPENLNHANDPVFIASGRTLQKIKADHDDTGIMMGFEKENTFSATVVLADYISQGWTPAQAETINLFLQNEKLSYTEAGRRLGKSRQVITKALKSSGYEAIQSALTSLILGVLFGE